jgi:hypothetical protein
MVSPFEAERDSNFCLLGDKSLESASKFSWDERTVSITGMRIGEVLALQKKSKKMMRNTNSKI